jgi:hypothetical protein
MAVTVPSQITALPVPPSTSSPTDFDAKADAFLGAFPTFRSEVNTVATQTYDNAVEAQTQASVALSQVALATAQVALAENSATQAAAAAGAAKWISGTTYSLGSVVWSPVTYLIYRRTIAGAGTTDPSSDTTNWGALSTATQQISVVSTTSATTTSNVHYVLTNAGSTTVTLNAAPANGELVKITVANGRTDNVVNRNANLLQGLSENMTLDTGNVTLDLRFINPTIGWRIV